MTLEEQVWDYLRRRTQFRSAGQISRRLTVSISYTKHLLISYYKRGLLDKIVKDKTNYYRIKP